MTLVKLSKYKKLNDANIKNFSSILYYAGGEELDSCKDIIGEQEISNRFMFVCLCPSRDNTEDFMSFHMKHSGGRDGVLRYLASHPAIEKSYITDLVKYYKDDESFKTIKGSEVVNALIKDEALFKKNIKILQEEIKYVNPGCIVLVGKKVEKILQHYEIKNINGITTEVINHYSISSCPICSKDKNNRNRCKKCYKNYVLKTLGINE